MIELFTIKPLTWINGKAETSWNDTYVVTAITKGKKYKFLLEVQDPFSDGQYARYKFETVTQAVDKANELYLAVLHKHLSYSHTV